MTIEKPSIYELKVSLKKWDSMDNYVLQERSLKKLFSETYPENKSIDDVFIKYAL